MIECGIRVVLGLVWFNLVSEVLHTVLLSIIINQEGKICGRKEQTCCTAEDRTLINRSTCTSKVPVFSVALSNNVVSKPILW